MTVATKLRTTVQRSTILEEVRRSHDHPTAEEVHRRVRRTVSNVSLGTVYRNLAVLDRAGEIRQIHLMGEPARFDGEVQPHHHVRCSRCGRVEDVAASIGARLTEEAAAATGYRIDEHRIEFTGLCPTCRRRGGS
ncbi:MAG: transcriptional repressor [Candidatus Eisenbacteria bacterium]|uniref:Transcriptional repressor n=1 Tax=Eiseniibacteriota bacterium TaxID=2212470 RepID=A0A937XDL9_UNCEI|nr:transcriptional repressor [Candidatus Eisenbacteria bacterium]MBM3499544.1 transcriptional repressor [Armatimonadota bacterium]